VHRHQPEARRVLRRRHRLCSTTIGQTESGIVTARPASQNKPAASLTVQGVKAS